MKTFCRALLLDKDDLTMILAANVLLFSRFVTWKHLAKPPLPNNFPLAYFLIVCSPLDFETFSSMILAEPRLS